MSDSIGSFFSEHQNSPPRFGVVGGGSWASAIVKILRDNQIPVHWYLRDTEVIQHIQDHGHNPKYLRSVEFDRQDLELSADLSLVIDSAQVIILAVPAAFIQSLIKDLRPAQLAQKYMVSAIKGMIPQSEQLISDWLIDYFGLDAQQLAIIAGPCHAEEVAQEKKSYLTLASEEASNLRGLANCLENEYIQCTLSSDMEGIEYSAIMKNIVALAAGIAHGLNYGDNFLAVLIANALQEIQEFLGAQKAQERNLFDSAYLGDVIVTAYSQFSRNRTFGNMIGRGYSVQSAQMEMNMIAEGYYASQSIEHLRQEKGLKLPICEMVFRILYDSASPKEEMRTLESQLR